MKELINVAERLYKQLDGLQSKLASNLNSDDNEILLRTECFMLNVIKRKYNIIDLSEVFHNEAEKPDIRRVLLYDSRFCGYGVLKTMPPYVDKWSYIQKTYGIKRWAYIDDLLPKGGEE